MSKDTAIPPKPIPSVALNVNFEDEKRLRVLAMELAKGIEEPEKVLKKLQWDEADYAEISQSRIFQAMLSQYIQEWNGAGNTQRRVKLKSAVNIEAALPDFYSAMINPNEPLMARVKTLEVLSKIGGLGVSEAVSNQNSSGGNGQYFKLEIHLDRDKPPIIIDAGVMPDPVLGEDTPESKELHQSELLDDQPFEELTGEN